MNRWTCVLLGKPYGRGSVRTIRPKRDLPTFSFGGSLSNKKSFFFPSFTLTSHSNALFVVLLPSFPPSLASSSSCSCTLTLSSPLTPPPSASSSLCEQNSSIVHVTPCFMLFPPSDASLKPDHLLTLMLLLHFSFCCFFVHLGLADLRKRVITQH